MKCRMCKTKERAVWSGLCQECLKKQEKTDKEKLKLQVLNEFDQFKKDKRIWIEEQNRKLIYSKIKSM